MADPRLHTTSAYCRCQNEHWEEAFEPLFFEKDTSRKIRKVKLLNFKLKVQKYHVEGMKWNIAGSAPPSNSVSFKLSTK